MSQSSEFQMLGTLVSMSVVQGGPGFPVLLPVVYDYIVKGQYSLHDIADTDIPDLEVQTLISEVCKFIIIHINYIIFYR